MVTTEAGGRVLLCKQQRMAKFMPAEEEVKMQMQVESTAAKPPGGVQH